MVLLSIIREICDQRQSNAYRHVTVHSNLYLKQHVIKLAQINPKCIWDHEAESVTSHASRVIKEWPDS